MREPFDVGEVRFRCVAVEHLQSRILARNVADKSLPSLRLSLLFFLLTNYMSSRTV